MRHRSYPPRCSRPSCDPDGIPIAEIGPLAHGPSVKVARSMSDPSPDLSRNRRVIEEFRANRGSVRIATVAGDDVSADALEGLPDPALLILHTVGAKTGQQRESPLAYQPIGRNFAVFGSNGARPEQPGWYRNLLANPEAQIEIGDETIFVRARIAEGAERAGIWAKQKEMNPAFAAYEERLQRELPVVILERG